MHAAYCSGGMKRFGINRQQTRCFGVESKSGIRFLVVFIRSVFFIELTAPGPEREAGMGKNSAWLRK